MRARNPDREGLTDSGGVPIFWEQHGTTGPAVLLVPPWQIVDSRIWKAQVSYLARYFRVVTYDPPGNGRSGRPATGFDHDQAAADALAVLDATGADRASLVCFSRGTWQGVLLAARHPERVDRLVLIATALAEGPRAPGFHDVRAQYRGWEQFNANFWASDYRAFVEFFFGEMYPEPHSTKQQEDAIGWAMGITPQRLAATIDEAK